MGCMFSGLYAVAETAAIKQENKKIKESSDAMTSCSQGVTVLVDKTDKKIDKLEKMSEDNLKQAREYMKKGDKKNAAFHMGRYKKNLATRDGFLNIKDMLMDYENKIGLTVSTNETMLFMKGSSRIINKNNISVKDAEAIMEETQNSSENTQDVDKILQEVMTQFNTMSQACYVNIASEDDDTLLQELEELMETTPEVKQQQKQLDIPMQNNKTTAAAGTASTKLRKQLVAKTAELQAV